MASEEARLILRGLPKAGAVKTPEQRNRGHNWDLATTAPPGGTRWARKARLSGEKEPPLATRRLCDDRGGLSLRAARTPWLPCLLLSSIFAGTPVDGSESRRNQQERTRFGSDGQRPARRTRRTRWHIHQRRNKPPSAALHGNHI